jgi:predicted 2-oxoglutarate/Fe(II)-dependent dioxygenase YbiX
MVPDPAKRRILVELAELMGWMMQTNADAKSLKKLEKTRLNLLRMWVDT